jgi:hypothetical protein
MATLAQRIQQEPDAFRVFLLLVNYRSGGVAGQQWFSDREWRFGPSVAYGHINPDPRLRGGLNVETIGDDGGLLGGVIAVDEGVWELVNLDGALDAWRGYFVDGQVMIGWMVGKLSDGTLVGLDDVLNEPVFKGVGVGRPKRSWDLLRIKAQSAGYQLERPINPRLFSPPCPHFPATTAGCINFGNVWNQTGTHTIEAWVEVTDPTVSGQKVWDKDTGTSGWGLEVGTAGAGTVRYFCRQQTPVNTDTGVVVTLATWVHVAVVVDTTAGTRKVYINGVLTVTSSGVVGSPATNAANFRVGSGLGGRTSQGRVWNTARSVTQIRGNMYLPLVGNETGLVANPGMEDGRGATTSDTKTGSVITGSLDSSVTWTTSDWCEPSLVGKPWPKAMGLVQDVPLLPIDPAQNIWAAALGPLPYGGAVRSNHNALAGAAYSWDLPRGLVTLVSAASGELSADVCGQVPFSGAIGFDGSTSFGTTTVTCPAGAMTLEMLVRPRTTAATTRYCGGWRNGTSAGARFLVFDTFGQNSIIVQVRNDSGVSFVARKVGLVQDRCYHVAGVLDPASGFLYLYVDGVLEASTAISGTWNTVLSTFVVARMPDAASNFLNAVLDEVRIWSVARTQAQIQTGMIAEITSGTGLVRRWGFNETSGTAATDSVAAGAMTLTAPSWTYSRITHADIVRDTLTSAAGVSAGSIDSTSSASFARDVPGDSGWLVTDSTTCREALHGILQGVGSYLVPVDSTYFMGEIELPTGTPDEACDFASWAYPLSRRPAPDEDATEASVYLISLGYSQNNARMDGSAVAGLLTTDPARFAYATQQWRRAPASDFSILTDEPQARTLEIDSALLRKADAFVVAQRMLPFYGPTRERIWFPMKAAGLPIRIFGEMRWTLVNGDGVTRLECGPPGSCFRVLRLRRVVGKSVNVEAMGFR